MVEVEPIGGNQELRIGVGLRILVDFGIKLKLGSFGLKSVKNAAPNCVLALQFS